MLVFDLQTNLKCSYSPGGILCTKLYSSIQLLLTCTPEAPDLSYFLKGPKQNHLRINHRESTVKSKDITSFLYQWLIYWHFYTAMNDYTEDYFWLSVYDLHSK